MDLFEKCAKAAAYESGLKQSGHYFFFRRLESPQDSEVVVNGKRVIMVDDAHAIGVLGNGGRGTAEHFGIENEVDIIKGGKTCGSDLNGTEGMTTYRRHRKADWL